MPRTMTFRPVEGGVAAAKGFCTAGVRCGIKQNKTALDLGLILSDRPCSVAAVYTTIAIPAASVGWTRSVTKKGTAQAVVVNSGNANACTGEQGDLMTLEARHGLTSTPDLQWRVVIVC